MSRAGELYALAERCERAEGPHYAIDAAIWCALNGVPLSDKKVADFERGQALRYTASLDAAMTLVPEGHIVMVTNTGVEDREADLTRSSAIVGPPTDTAGDYTSAATMSLALCAAALRARAAQEAE